MHEHRVARPYPSASYDPRHHPGVPANLPIDFGRYRLEQIRVHLIQLQTWIAHPSQFQQRLAEFEPRPNRQGHHFDPVHQDVLSQHAWFQRDALGRDIRMDAGVHQQHLAQVGLVRVSFRQVTVADEFTRMIIARHANTFDQSNGLYFNFWQAGFRFPANRHYKALM